MSLIPDTGISAGASLLVMTMRATQYNDRHTGKEGVRVRDPPSLGGEQEAPAVAAAHNVPARWDVFEMFAHPRTGEPKQTQFLMVSAHRTRMLVVFAVPDLCLHKEIK